MSNQTKQRDYLFDNYKAFLILLVVIGHFIEPAYNNTAHKLHMELKACEPE